jgi:hypothetical protein
VNSLALRLSFTQLRSIIDKEKAIARQVLHASTEAKVEQLLPQQTSHQ